MLPVALLWWRYGWGVAVGSRGLVSAPVVAVPTSVGYGAGAGGIAPLLTMLNSCAPGVGVVNIDNGYGAGHLAAQITAR
ncbi:carboxylase [Corynebacterium renale]|nr:carboxylase [Corynebacterium renale]